MNATPAAALVGLRECSPQCLTAAPILGPITCHCACGGEYHGVFGAYWVRPRRRRRECLQQLTMLPGDESLAA